MSNLKGVGGGKVTLDGRLSAVSALVRRGAVFADIGTDHAYLPLYLLQEGRISRAVASDVAEGPLERARRNVMSVGQSERVTLLLTDGLSGMEKMGLTDIAICGMGGEVIASILSAAPFVFDPSIRLILQPMSRVPLLRKYLYENGFTIEEERVATSSGKIYFCLAAAYGAPPRVPTETELLIGSPRLICEEEKTVYLAYLQTQKKAAEKRLEGKRAGGLSTEEEEKFLRALLTESERVENDGK